MQNNQELEVVYLIDQKTKAHTDRTCYDSDEYWGWVYLTVERAQQDIDAEVECMLNFDPCDPENHDPANPPSITESERDAWRCRFPADAQDGNKRTTVRHWLDTDGGIFKADSVFEIVPFPAKDGKIC